jgi:hypothetical protein
VFPALIGRRVRLQELLVGIGLQFDHVRRHDNLFDFAEIDSFSDSRWHLGFLVWLATVPAGNFQSTTQGKHAAFNSELA